MPTFKTATVILAALVAAAGCGDADGPGTGTGEASAATGTAAANAGDAGTAAGFAGPATVEAAGMFAVPLEDLDGRRITLAEHAGKPMLIEVWATWCGPCRRVRSIIKEHQAELSEVATLVGVSVDQGGRDVVKAYLAKSDGPSMIECMATPEFRAAIAPLDTANTIPKLVYIGADGRIANLSHGVNSPTFMIGLLRNLGARAAG